MSGRDDRPLKATVLSCYLVAHQIFAIKLCSWLMNDLFPKCSGFRALFYEVLAEKALIESEHCSYLEHILIKSGIVWKDVRRKWLELLAEVALKVSLATRFLALIMDLSEIVFLLFRHLKTKSKLASCT